MFESSGSFGGSEGFGRLKSFKGFDSFESSESFGGSEGFGRLKSFKGFDSF